MQKRFGKLVSASLVAAVAVMVGSSAYANELSGRASLANGKKIFEQGKNEVPACNSCHGPEGAGDDNMGTPRIGGQIFQFLVKQLEDFATDKRQDTTMFVMNTNAKGLSPQDRADVAAFLSQMGGKPTPSNLVELKANGTAVGQPHLGKSLVLFGAPEKGIPACKSCHDYNGRGAEPMYPKIGEQRYVYLVNQLKKWRDGSRANDPKGQMRAVAQKLSDDDINNAAAYLTSASPYSLGNKGLPARHLATKFDNN